MVIVVCVCQNNGLMFNHRRQSRDRAVLEDLADVCGAGRPVSYTHLRAHETL